MIVLIEQELWTAGQADPAALVALCHVCDRECHALLTQPAWDELNPDQPISIWLSSHTDASGALTPVAQQVARILRDGQLRHSALDRPKVPRLHIAPTNTDWSQGRLDLHAALLLLHMPLRVKVEDAENDGAFLQSMALPAHRRFMEQALEQRWAELEHSGGIDGIIKHLTRVSTPADDSTWRSRVRTWVMFDRDADETNRSAPSTKSEQARQKLGSGALDLPWNPGGHQLRRRAIENYVPLATLSSWWAQNGSNDQPLRAAKVAALGKLSANFRYQFNMKRGLVGDIPNGTLNKEQRDALKNGARAMEVEQIKRSWPQEYVDELFGGLTAAERQALHNGFSDLGRAWAGGRVTNEALRSEGTESERRDLENERLEILESLLRRL